jgi:hypothetical protein
MVATDNEALWDDAGIAEQRSIQMIGTESFCIEHEVAITLEFVCSGRV